MKENKNSDRESPYQEAVILLLEPVNVLIPFSYQGTLSAIQLYKAIKKLSFCVRRNLSSSTTWELDTLYDVSYRHPDKCE